LKWLSDKADLIFGSFLGMLLTLAGSLFILRRQRRLELADARCERIYAPLYDELSEVGKAERKVLEAYLKGERLKGYTTLLTRIRQMGLRAIIDGCQQDLELLKRLAQRQ